MYELDSHESEPQEEGAFFRQLVGVFAVLVFLADIYLLAVLTATLVSYEPLESTQPLIVQFILVTIVYIFGLVLFLYARPAYSRMYDVIIYLLGWVYILLSAFLLAVVAQDFVSEPGYGFGDFLGYAGIVVVFCSFGFIISSLVNERVIYFAFPFLIVALYQVYLWVWRVSSTAVVPGGWNLVGSIFLFIFTIVFIGLLLVTDRSRGRNPNRDDGDGWQYP